MSDASGGAIVFGATGYTGREVVRQLREAGVATVAHIRPGSRSARWAEAFRGHGAEVVELPFEPDALRELIARVQPQVVFALIGTTRALAKKERLEARDIYDAVDYRLTAMIIDAAKEAKPDCRLVYLSSIGANRASRNRYVAARGRTEDALVASGLPYTIARPSFIAGPGRDDFRLAEALGSRVADIALGAARLLGGKKLADRYGSMDNVELGKALVTAAYDPAYENQILSAEELRAL